MLQALSTLAFFVGTTYGNCLKFTVENDDKLSGIYEYESQVSGATYYKKENGGYYLTGPGFNVLTSDTVTPFLRAKGLQTEFDVIICTSNDPQNCQWMNKDGEIVSGVTMEDVDCPQSPPSRRLAQPDANGCYCRETFEPFFNICKNKAQVACERDSRCIYYCPTVPATTENQQTTQGGETSTTSGASSTVSQTTTTTTEGVGSSTTSSSAAQTTEEGGEGTESPVSTTTTTSSTAEGTGEPSVTTTATGEPIVTDEPSANNGSTTTTTESETTSNPESSSTTTTTEDLGLGTGEPSETTTTTAETTTTTSSVSQSTESTTTGSTTTTTTEDLSDITTQAQPDDEPEEVCECLRNDGNPNAQNCNGITGKATCESRPKCFWSCTLPSSEPVDVNIKCCKAKIRGMTAVCGFFNERICDVFNKFCEYDDTIDGC